MENPHDIEGTMILEGSNQISKVHSEATPWILGGVRNLHDSSVFENVTTTLSESVP